MEQIPMYNVNTRQRREALIILSILSVLVHLLSFVCFLLEKLSAQK